MKENKLEVLCRHSTNLVETDIKILSDIECQLPLMASLAGTDIFIDAPLPNGTDSIVLAWAHDEKRRSLYRKSVVGEIAKADHEPAVAQAIASGEKVVDVRGLSQEGVPISQTVTPIFSQEKIIGVLIMERDISREVQQEKRVEFLQQTADHLSQTLMSLTTTGCGWDEWLGNGIFVLDPQGQITYANKRAVKLAANFWRTSVLQQNLREFLHYSSLEEMVRVLKNSRNFQYGEESYLFRAHPLVARSELSGCVVSVQDVTELRQKEKQLDMQSIMIAEINHRVKNTLQNVISLLHMQMRRTQEIRVKEEFMACINRILSIAKVYEVFTYQSRDLVDLKELAAYIVEKIMESCTLQQKQLPGRTGGGKIFIHAKQAVPVALVLNELVSNAVKHGSRERNQMNRLGVSIVCVADQVRIEVWNNGALLPENLTESDKKDSLGLYLVRLFVCDQLKGQFSLQNKKDCVNAEVSFPLCGLDETEEENMDEIIIDFNR